MLSAEFRHYRKQTNNATGAFGLVLGDILMESGVLGASNRDRQHWRSLERHTVIS